VGDAPGFPAITQLAQALREEKTRFIVVGMRNWNGQTLAILPLEGVYKSKKAAGRPKGLAVLRLLGRTIRPKAGTK
jgi:hypothetical protein